VPLTVAPPSDAGSARRPLPIDPRIRERRIAVRRAEGRRRLKFLCVLLAVIVLGASAIGITQSSLLAVHHVEVSGLVHTTPTEVLTAARLEHHARMVNVHPGQVAQRLDALPWVATAVVQRHWPSTVRIRVTERTAVANVPAGSGQMAVVDAMGRVLAVAPAPAAPAAGPAPATPATSSAPAHPSARAHPTPPASAQPAPPPAGWSSLPIIRGLAPAGPPGSTEGDSEALAALALVSAVNRGFPAALAARVTTVTIADSQLRAVIAPSINVRLGTANQLDAKLLALRALLERVDLKGVAVIDVRVPDAPVLTRQDQAGTVSTTPRG
jgi:hypothetical protein